MLQATNNEKRDGLHITMIAAMYVSSADLLSVHYVTIFAGWAVMNHIITNWGVGACTGMGASPLRTVKAAYLHMNCTPMTCIHGEFNC